MRVEKIDIAGLRPGDVAFNRDCLVRIRETKVFPEDHDVRLIRLDCPSGYYPWVSWSDSPTGNPISAYFQNRPLLGGGRSPKFSRKEDLATTFAYAHVPVFVLRDFEVIPRAQLTLYDLRKGDMLAGIRPGCFQPYWVAEPGDAETQRHPLLVLPKNLKDAQARGLDAYLDDIRGRFPLRSLDEFRIAPIYRTRR